jgi:lipopolysaccharide export system permease protein
MSILDRYIIKTYLLNFVILLAVLIALFIVGGVLIDLDEYISAGEMYAGRYGGSTLKWTLWAVFDYNGPLQLMLYAFFSGLVCVGAAGFTLTGLARTRELTAMLSSGISMYRIAMPMLLAGFGLNMLASLDQEFILPPLAQKVSRNTSEMKQTNVKSQPIYFMTDQLGRLFSAGHFRQDEGAGIMTDVTILERDAEGRAVQRIVASQATWNEQKNGWELTDGYALVRPVDNAVNPVVTTTASTHQIEFIASDLSPTVIRARLESNYLNLLSVRKLQSLSHNSQLDQGKIRQIMHGRMSQLVLNMLVLTMGLTFFLSREPTSTLVQAMKATGLCIGAWSMGLTMQNADISWLNPVATAWLPVVIYIPVTAVTLQMLKT